MPNMLYFCHFSRHSRAQMSHYRACYFISKLFVPTEETYNSHRHGQHGPETLQNTEKKSRACQLPFATLEECVFLTFF